MTFEEKTLATETLYEGRIINLRRDKVTVINGESTREVVEHNGGSAIVPVTEDGKVILVRQYRKPMEDVILEVPAGKLEKGEDPVVTAVRELEEETGYRADSMEYLTVMYPSVGYTTEKLYLYMATGLIAGTPHPDDNEALDVVEMDLEEACTRIASGEIHDAKTIICLLMARDRLRATKK